MNVNDTAHSNLLEVRLHSDRRLALVCRLDEFLHRRASACEDKFIALIKA